MNERGAASAARESMADISEVPGESTVVIREKKIPALRLVQESEDHIKPVSEHLFIGAGASFRKQSKGSDGQWVDIPGPNEDMVGIDHKTGLVLVADGFGGHEEGEKASSAAAAAMKITVLRELEEAFMLSADLQKRNPHAETELRGARVFVENTLQLDPSLFSSQEDVERALQNGLIEANRAVAKETKKGGTTMSAALIYETLDGKPKVKIINCGDSRIYLYRRDKLQQLTKDDSFVGHLLKKRLLVDGDDENVEAQLSPKALKYLRDINPNGDYPEGTTVGQIRNVVTEGLSAIDGQVEKRIVDGFDLEAGDMLLEATDGVTDNLTRDQLAQIILKNADQNPHDIAAELVRESKRVAHGESPRAKEDDISVAVVRIEAGHSLKVILEGKLDEWKKELKNVEQSSKLFEMLLALYIVRNQLEFAVEGHPKNEKLSALRDHVVKRLQLLDSRARELKRSELATEMERVKKAN
ncbi:MAG: SpoIIE family protein phosphatase [bacterium]|nr:SpoIIE family protein phosphatase [bacterium]